MISPLQFGVSSLDGSSSCELLEEGYFVTPLSTADLGGSRRRSSEGGFLPRTSPQHLGEDPRAGSDTRRLLEGTALPGSLRGSPVPSSAALRAAYEPPTAYTNPLGYTDALHGDLLDQGLPPPTGGVLSHDLLLRRLRPSAPSSIAPGPLASYRHPSPIGPYTAPINTYGPTMGVVRVPPTGEPLGAASIRRVTSQAGQRYPNESAV